MKRLIFLATLSIFILTGCSSSHQQTVDTTNLQDLQDLTMQQLTPDQPMVSKIRQQALKETAMTIGAQGGLAKRAGQIDAMLAENDTELSSIFYFNGLMLNYSVLPPVLVESTSSLNLEDTTTITTADRTYKLLKDARFVTTPPTWRDYLWMNYSKPDVPDSTLLPKDKQERNIWIKYVNMGWQSGIDQANNIYSDNLAKLQRDYQGMMLYRKLLAQHMVSKPIIASTNMGITSNSAHTELQINNRITRITSTPRLDPNSNNWNPVMIQP